MEDHERAVKALFAKQAEYDTRFAYYDGNHPIVYTTKRMYEIFQNIKLRFNENWCALVVNAVLDRIWFGGASCTKARADNALKDMWRRLALDVEADDVHSGALVAGEAFFIAWKDEQGRADGYYNDPRMCHVFYDSERPRIKKFAAKWWAEDEDGKLHLTLYYPDRLEYYESENETDELAENTAFELVEKAVNPYGVINVFHFLPETRRAKSDLTNAIPIQVAINKLVNDLMVTAEFSAFRQRWIISNAETDGLINAPNEIWEVPAGDGEGEDTKVGEFAASDLQNYIGGIEHFANALSSITGVPRHYFFHRGGEVSGEALRAMEAPLVKKARKRTQQFRAEWRQALAFMLLIEGYKVEPKEINCHFETPESTQPLYEAQTRRENKEAGIPIAVQLEMEGKDAAYIEKVVAANRDGLADNK